MTLKQAFVDRHPDSEPSFGILDHFHLQNPTVAPWSAVARAISQHKGSNLPLVPVKIWLSKVREHGIEDAEKVPAIRLLDFYEHMENLPALDVTETLKIAPQVDYGAPTSKLLEKYLEYQRL